MPVKGVGLGEDFVVNLTLQVNNDCDSVDMSLDIKDEAKMQIAHVSNYDSRFQLRNVKAGETYNVRCIMKGVNLAPGAYTAHLWLGNPYEHYDWLGNCLSFYITQNEEFIKRETPYGESNKVVIPSEWTLK